MYERFTDRARKVMQLANQEAQRFNHEYIGTEHILLGLVKEGSGVAAQVLKNLDIDLRKIRLEVEKIVLPGPDTVNMGKLPQTPRAKKVIEYAIEEARNLNHNYVGTEHLLLGLLREEEAVAAQVLLNLGLKWEDVREETLQVLAKTGDPIRSQLDNPQLTSASKTATLDSLGIDLTELARVGKLDPIIGRHDDVERLLLILGCRNQCNALLIGEAGIGRTAIVEKLAWLLAGPDCPERFHDCRLIELDLDLLVLWTTDSRHLERAIRDIIKELHNVKNVILFLRNLEPVLSPSSAPAWHFACHLFQGALSQGKVQCIAAATPRYYQAMLTHDIITRQFQPLFVRPPSREDTLAILHSLRDQYEAHHRVQIDDEALDAAIDLSEQYVPEQCLPGKAVCLLDQAGSLVRLRNAPRRPDALQTFKTQIADLTQEKEKAVAEQDFAKAAELRDQCDQLKKQQEEATRDWLKQSVEVNVGRVERETVAEVARKMCGISPTEGK